VPVQPAAVELLTSLAPVLDRWGRWLVFGAQAVIIHGVPRLSAVQSLDADRIRAVLRLLQEALDRSDLLPAFESIARGRPGA
jgi:hypothetical protein